MGEATLGAYFTDALLAEAKKACKNTHLNAPVQAMTSGIV